MTSSRNHRLIDATCTLMLRRPRSSWPSHLRGAARLIRRDSPRPYRRMSSPVRIRVKCGPQPWSRESSSSLPRHWDPPQTTAATRSTSSGESARRYGNPQPWKKLRATSIPLVISVPRFNSGPRKGVNRGIAVSKCIRCVRPNAATPARLRAVLTKTLAQTRASAATLPSFR